MHLTSSARRLATSGVVGTVAALVLAAFPGAASAAPHPEPHAAATATTVGPTAPATALHAVADLAAQRLATAGLVAAAKYGTGGPIDDPVREQQVLDAVAQHAREIGADPNETVRVFRDQIEANKLVQRALFSRWDAHPGEAPTERPDLGQVRQEINRINGALVRALAESAALRHAPSCDGRLVAAAAHVRHEHRLDALHTTALARALPSVCAPRS
ncbi:chorismate mutase [Streptomyces sp. NPDC015127]|uniref:chorismate mutase n=1 Tax=Streptomyces sp. NPDC015127 TaxID=3364939 RepID=UPI0036FB1768